MAQIINKHECTTTYQNMNCTRNCKVVADCDQSCQKQVDTTTNNNGTNSTDNQQKPDTNLEIKTKQ